jgi:hypothetical protein
MPTRRGCLLPSRHSVGQAPAHGLSRSWCSGVFRSRAVRPESTMPRRASWPLRPRYGARWGGARPPPGYPIGADAGASGSSASGLEGPGRWDGPCPSAHGRLERGHASGEGRSLACASARRGSARRGRRAPWCRRRPHALLHGGPRVERDGARWAAAARARGGDKPTSPGGAGARRSSGGGRQWSPAALGAGPGARPPPTRRAAGDPPCDVLRDAGPAAGPAGPRAPAARPRHGIGTQAAGAWGHAGLSRPRPRRGDPSTPPAGGSVRHRPGVWP